MVAAVVFIAITISAMALVYQTGIPIIKRMQSSASLDSMTSAFADLDETIQRVASEGNGSRRIFTLDSGEGRLSVDSASDQIAWELDAESSVLRSRSARYLGNVVSGSNLEASLYDGVYGSYQAYILENNHLRVYIRNIPSGQSYSTGDILLDVYQKDLCEWLPMDYLNISLDGDTSSMSGTGYTEAERLGMNLPSARVTAYMDSIYADYSVSFALESGADFLVIEAEIMS